MEIELLAPVGSFEALEAAVQNGADAVYLGGTLFSARQNAKNFDDEVLKEAVAYCHIRGVKVFVTVNTLVSNQELIELGKYLAFLYNIDVDAIIVQDLGIAKFVKELLPDFEMHGSTQMSVHNLQGVKQLEDMSFQRAVLAREMSKEEIEWVRKNSKIDIEVFVHGALCVSYSGQCLMSSMIGGRSGNRGRCAQPCRKTYDLIDMHSGKKISSPLGDYLLSPRDLNTLENIDEVLDTGIKSLKIEGRMKRAEYVATVVNAYRKAIDQYILNKGKPEIDAQISNDVKQIFNRRFTKGYILAETGNKIMNFMKPGNRGIKIGKVIDYDKNKRKVKIKLEGFLSKGDGIEIWSRKGDNPGTIVENIFKKGEKKETANHGEIIEIKFNKTVLKDSPVYKTSDSALLKRAKETYEKKDKKIALYGKFKGKLDHAIELLLWDDDGNYIEEKGEYIVQEALKTSITEERISEQIAKLGNTPYELKTLEMQLDQGVAISIGQLNNLRRNVIEKMNQLRENHNHRENIDLKAFYEKTKTWIKNKQGIKSEHIGLRVYVNNIIQLKAVLKFHIDRIYYSDIATIDEALKIAEPYNTPLIPTFSRITEDVELVNINKKMHTLEKLSGLMASNLGVLNMLKDFKDIKIITDFSLNVFNNGSIECLKEMNVEEITLSPELTLKQIKEIIKQSELPCEVIVHGNLPLMISKYCPISTMLKDGQKHCNLCKNNQFGLKDPLGMTFPIVRDSNCRIQILNAQKLCLIESIKELMDGGIRHMRIQFTTEDEKEIVSTLKAYMKTIKNTLEGNKEQSQETKDFIKNMKEQGLTKGHFFRGVM